MPVTPEFSSPVAVAPIVTICNHVTYDIDDEGYVCSTCKQRLVYCWACVDKIIRGVAVGTGIHIAPNCPEPAPTLHRRSALTNRDGQTIAGKILRES